jgi:hypothetical protein
MNFERKALKDTYLTMLISGRDVYGEGRTCKFSAGGVLKVYSSQLLCHERAIIKGVHPQNKINRVHKTI